MYYFTEPHIIKTVTECKEGFSVSTEESTGFWVEKKYLNNKSIKKGDIILLYLYNGSRIIGMDLNGSRLFLKTEEQIKQEDLEWLAKREREKQERFEKEKDAMDARFNSLPKLLQHRLAMYRMFNENFRRDEETYEEHAMRIGYEISRICKNEEDVESFAGLKWAKQVKMIPEMEDLTGNMFGFACYFAKGLLKDGKIVDINNPQIDKLIDCRIMLMANASAPFSGALCQPRKEYIEKYINTLRESGNA